ncbi:MAG TPA: CPP1-like family protein [Thermosynechococcus sp. M46_R2017_013]|nr:CPP1-like family protein [Thermosynechococcus sp. M46_R2017_013]
MNKDQFAMSDNPYEKLQVPEDASFEQIKEARDALLAAHSGDERQRTEIEAAYDAILMDRLRQRQEGKIKVPERIRYAEQLNEAAPAKLNPIAHHPAFQWWQQQLDTPSLRSMIITSTVYGVLMAIGLSQANADTLALVLSLGLGFNLVWLQRKEQRLGRAFLITLLALILGTVIALGIHQLSLSGLPLNVDQLVGIGVFVSFWLASNFLR